ncbi:hypothetical protein MHU86_9386 [Fragilaria crotonensis]|nr:hypothetical protein MHU86_9386 [Fragilaria crotonensis]
MQLTTTATNGSVLPPVRTGRRITNITLPFARTESPHGIGTFRTQRQPDVKELDSRLLSRRQPAGLPTGLRGRGTPASTRAALRRGLLLSLLSLPASSLEPAGEAPGTVTGSTRGPSSLHNFLLCSRERSVKMVPEGRVPPPGHKPEFLPIRTGNRRAVSDNSAIPADGHTMAKLHRHAVELGSSIWSYAVATNSRVDAHVHGVPNPLATFQHLHSLPKILTHVTAIVVDDVNVTIVIVTVIVVVVVVTIDNVPITSTPAVDRRKDDAVHRRNRTQTGVPLGVPYNGVHLREATTPKDRQVNLLLPSLLRPNLPFPIPPVHDHLSHSINATSIGRHRALSCFLAGEGRAMPVPTSQQPATEDGCRERALQQRQSTRNPGVDYLFVEKSARTIRGDDDVATNNQNKSTS